MPGPETPPDSAAGEPPRGRWGIIRTVFVLGVAGLLAVALGFGWFLWRIPADEIVLNEKAEGIVVLTGGAARVADAIQLLAGGHGQRLLISGVHPATRSDEISRLNPDFARVVRCCVDLDPEPRNTLGNATGTRRWVRERGFRRLIVVTSSYHMPRAMAELAHQLSGVELIPYPVVTDKLRAEPWYVSSATMRLVFSEYLKYLFALGRMRIEDIIDTDNWS
jgi:uncharacterized SAM-binding protein YcdF (DUF218 family)